MIDALSQSRSELGDGRIVMVADKAMNTSDNSTQPPP
jgi:hypothetical protein